MGLFKCWTLLKVRSVVFDTEDTFGGIITVLSVLVREYPQDLTEAYCLDLTVLVKYAFLLNVSVSEKGVTIVK